MDTRADGLYVQPESVLPGWAGAEGDCTLLDWVTPQHAGAVPSRRAGKRLLMCPPDHFDVVYEINPWMHTDDGVDVTLARTQWRALQSVYRNLGYEIDSIDGEPGLPDMVFTANGGLVIGEKA